MIDQQKLTDLRAKAEAATAGPWVRHHERYGVSVRNADGGFDWVGSCDTEADCNFVASANPTVVLAMIDEIERLRGELRQAVDLIEQAAPKFTSYEECMDAQDQGEDCIGRDHHDHELRMQMDEFVERNKQ